MLAMAGALLVRWTDDEQPVSGRVNFADRASGQEWSEGSVMLFETESRIGKLEGRLLMPSDADST